MREMTEEALWGQDTQLFQTDFHQLFFFKGRERRYGVPKHLLKHAQVEVGLWKGGCYEVTMRLLLYSLHTVIVLFTRELLSWGLTGNVQSRRLLINAVSGFWQHKQQVTQSSILLCKDYTYVQRIRVHWYHFIIAMWYGGLFVNG